MLMDATGRYQVRYDRNVMPSPLFALRGKFHVLDTSIFRCPLHLTSSILCSITCSETIMCLEQASHEMQHKTYSSAVAKVQCVS